MTLPFTAPLRAESPASSPTEASPSVPSSQETPELAKPTASCELLSKGPGVALADKEVMLHTTLESIMSDLQSDKFDKFNRHFHRRAKVKSDIGDKLRSILAGRYDSPWQFSVFRVWRLKSPDSIKPVFDDCPEADGARIIGSYGYETQYAVWIQIMGQNELGRLIFSIAPDKGKVLIAGFRVQQWTQLGSDWRVWGSRGEQAEMNKNLRDAYFNYDIAQKLIDGKDFVVYPIQASIKQKRDEMFKQSELVTALNRDLGISSIAYVGTLLAKEGEGYFIRETIKGERPHGELMDLCLDRGRRMKTKGWLKDSQGLRCNFLFKGMDPQRDSALGGFYFTAADIRNTKK